MITNLPYDNLNYILDYLDSKSAFKMFMTCIWFYFNFNEYIVSNHKILNLSYFMILFIKQYSTIQKDIYLVETLKKFKNV